MLITPGDPESDEVNACGGTSCATPHVGGAAALLWGDVAADGGAGSVAQRVRDRLVAQALDVGAPGADYVFGAGRLRLDLAAPVLGTPTPAPNSLVRGIVSLSLPLAEAGTLGLQQLSVDGQPLVATLAPGGLLQADVADRGARARPARHLAGQLGSERQRRHLHDHAARRQPSSEGAPAHAHARPGARQGARVGLGARCRQRPRRAAAHPFGDGSKANGFHLAHRYKHPGRYTVTIRCSDRAGNSVTVRRTLRILPALAKPIS